MTNDSGGGGSNKSTRSMPKDTPVGYQGVGGDTGQQIDNIQGAFERQAAERRASIDEQVRRADQQAYVNQMGSSAYASHRAEGHGRTSAAPHDGLPEHFADAIIGAILIGQFARNTVTLPGHDERDKHGFRGYDKEHPAPTGDVFKLDPNGKPAPVLRDSRLQDTQRSKDRQAWSNGVAVAREATDGVNGTPEDPGWTN